jgi:hypothetical protein
MVRADARPVRDRTAEHRRESALPPAPPLRQSVLRPSARRSPDAQKIVALWNARQAGGRELWFYPTIGAAIAGLPWLSFSCQPVIKSAQLTSEHSIAIPAARS